MKAGSARTGFAQARAVMAAVATACGLLAGASAWAAHPLITDDTGTQGTGHWQLEINTDQTRSRADGATSRAGQLNTTLTHGLTDDLDVALTLPLLRLRPAGGPNTSGVGDAAVQAKWRLLGPEGGEDGGSLALKPMLLLPTGDDGRGLGTGRAGASLNLLAAWQAGQVTALGNLGASYNGNRAGDRTALWNASAAVLVTPLPALTLALDVGASRNPQHGTGATLRYGLLGAIWHVDDKTDLDLGWRRNLGGGQTANTWGVGLTLRW